MICQTLAAKGIDPQTIQDCMEELELDDTENIRKICEKKFGDLNSMSPGAKTESLSILPAARV